LAERNLLKSWLRNIAILILTNHLIALWNKVVYLLLTKLKKYVKEKNNN